MPDSNPIGDVLARTEAMLGARPLRQPDYPAENEALLKLADGLANRPDKVLQQLSDILMEICDAGSAGVSLPVSPDPDADFVWPAIAGAWSGFVGGRMPRYASPCGSVVDRDTVLIYPDVHLEFPAAVGIDPPIVEVMVAPFREDGKAVGTVWVISHDRTRKFDREDARLLQNLARFAAAAYASSRADEKARLVRDHLALTLSNTQIVGLWEWNIQKDTVVADRRFAGLYGVDPEAAAAGVPVARFVEGIHPDDRDRVGAEIASAVQTGAPFVSEYRVMPSSGGVRYVLARGEAHRDAEGQPSRFPGVVIDITEQRQAETALDRTRDRYKTLFESIETGFCVIEMIYDAHGLPTDYRFIETNPAFERHTGLSHAVGRTARELVPHEQHWYDFYGRVALTGQSARTENPVDALDRWYEVYACPTGPSDGNQVAVLFTDISERRQMELALRASEREFRTLAEAMPNHIWTAQPNGGLDWFNEQVYAYSGAERGELDGDAWASIVHPDDLTPAAAAWAAALGAGSPYQTEFRLRRQDGIYRWHIARAIPLLDGDGAITRWVGSNTDIQDQKEAAEALAELNATLEERVEARTRALKDSEDFARLALSAVSGVGVWTYDVATDRFICDANISKLYGLDPAAGTAGLTAADFLANVHTDDRAALTKTMADGLTRGGDIELEYRLQHDDGSVHWVLSRGHTYFEQGKPVRRTGVGIETTRMRELEEQLRQSQKMEAVGQLTGGIAHDFNNMLTSISGSLEMLQRRMASGRSDGVERFMDIATGSVQRAAGLTHRLLAFARRQPLDTKSHDVAKLIGDMEDMLHRTLGEHVGLETHIEPNLWHGLTDANQFENALLNLTINARDAMPDGGQLTIEARNAQLDEAYAKDRSDVIPGDYIAVAVSDTGVGMPADVIARAFEPFFTTKPMGQGTGLGLSVIYGFAKQAGGHVRIHSKPGQGTTVTLYVARALSSTMAEGRQATAQAPHGAGEAILLVEDDPAVRQVVGEVLRELGYRYYEADDVQSAIKIIESDVDIDLLLSDVGLPVMNGRQLAELAREHRPDLKVLFLTGYAENALVRSEFLAPGMDMMTKPFAVADLAKKVRALIA